VRTACNLTGKREGKRHAYSLLSPHTIVNSPTLCHSHLVRNDSLVVLHIWIFFIPFKSSTFLVQWEFFVGVQNDNKISFNKYQYTDIDDNLCG